MKPYTVFEIPALGYGNADAGISYTRMKEKARLDPEVETSAVEFITDGKCMKKITEKDDGCIDGRKAISLIMATLLNEEFTQLAIDNPMAHIRAKVAGGGYLTSLAIQLALEPEITSANEDFSRVIDRLVERGIVCGTHTGDHSSDGSVDCGANDKFEQILRSADSLRFEIRDTIIGLLEQTNQANLVSREAMQQSARGLETTLSHKDYFAGSNGQTRFDMIMQGISKLQQQSGREQSVSVSKHLEGNHNEAFIVLNFAEGVSFSQADFQRRQIEKHPDIAPKDLPQVFAVDVPRIVQLARAMAEGRDDPQHAFEVALFAGLAFQFATASYLTDGSLRTFVVHEPEEEVLAEAA